MKRIGVLTSGGDAPGMNAAVRAVVRSAIYHGVEVIGFERGYAGVLEGQGSQMDLRSVSGIINRGGTILRTARSEEFRSPEGRERAAGILKRFMVEGLVVIGGDGSYRGAAEIAEEHGIKVVGVPGTIDNDIGGTDFTIGFDTAVNTALEAIDKIRDTAASHDRLFIVEVMGRHSGAIALHVGLAGGAEYVAIPEMKTDGSEICRMLNTGFKTGKTSSIIVVAEGDDAGGALGLRALILEKTPYNDVRVSILGHLQRGGVPSAFDRVLASRLGAAAVDVLLAGETMKMTCMGQNKIVTSPITDAWEKPAPIDMDMVDLASILAT
ncbi:6-phosphofructokinase [Candidatus Hydrogenedentota bacterium]